MQCQANKNRVTIYCQRGQKEQCENLRLWHKDFVTGTINCNRLWLGGVLRGLTSRAPVYGMSQRGWGQPRLSSFVSTRPHQTASWGGARASIAQGQSFPPEQQGANARRSPSPDRGLMVTVRIWGVEWSCLSCIVGLQMIESLKWLH